MISLAKLKAALRITNTASDDLLTDLELAAVEVAQRQTNRFYGASGEDTEYVIGDGTDSLWLSEAPAAIPASVISRSSPGASSSTTITASDTDGYVLRDNMRLVRKGRLAWTKGYEFEVTYTRGYASEAEPDDIRQAVTALVTYWYEHRIPVEEVKNQVLPLHVTEIFDARWRRPWA